MVHIANSTLAGGVAIGTTANVVLHPVHAMIVGVLAGAISVIGYRYLTVRTLKLARMQPAISATH